MIGSTTLLMRKQLSVNHDKCKYMIMGTKKFREETLNELEREPMTMGGVVIDHAVSEKYLGDWVNELGCRQSITDTIKERRRKLTSKGNDIIMLAKAPIMGADGTSLVAIKLFEVQVIPALLLCESWIDVSDNQIRDLQGFQDNFLRKLMHLPISTPKAILHWDGGMQGMKWRIVGWNLLFLRKLMKKDGTNICRRAVANEAILGVIGLGHECKVLAEQMGLPDIRFNNVSKGDSFIYLVVSNHNYDFYTTYTIHGEYILIDKEKNFCSQDLVSGC